MGWLSGWRRKRLLERHRIDAALWQRAARGLGFVRSLGPAEGLNLISTSLATCGA